MGTTSWQVKEKYNQKTYSRWFAQIHKDKFEKIEKLRNNEGLSRSEFLLMLVKEKYGDVL